LDKERERITDEWEYMNKVKEKIEKDKTESAQQLQTNELSKTIPDSESSDTSSSELTKELLNLQAELKSDWNELRQQHDRLREAKKVFSRAKNHFEEHQERKMMRFDKIPIANLEFDKMG